MLLDNDNINLQQITKLLDNHRRTKIDITCGHAYYLYKRTFYAQIIEKYKYFKTEEV